MGGLKIETERGRQKRGQNGRAAGVRWACGRGCDGRAGLKENGGGGGGGLFMALVVN